MLATKELKVNKLKRTALDGKKSRSTLIGKQVKFVGSDITKQLKENEVYTIKSISAGNYDAFIYLEELAQTRYSEYSRKTVPNCFNIEQFELEA
jgi:hypothetical protein